MDKISKERIEKLKDEYPKGTPIRLLKLTDQYRTIPIGAEGTVSCVDDIGTVHVDWGGGSRLGLVPDEDEFEKVNK